MLLVVCQLSDDVINLRSGVIFFFFFASLAREGKKIDIKGEGMISGYNVIGYEDS